MSNPWISPYINYITWQLLIEKKKKIIIRNYTRTMTEQKENDPAVYKERKESQYSALTTFFISLTHAYAYFLI